MKIGMVYPLIAPDSVTAAMTIVTATPSAPMMPSIEHSELNDSVKTRPAIVVETSAGHDPESHVDWEMDVVRSCDSRLLSFAGLSVTPESVPVAAALPRSESVVEVSNNVQLRLC
jgi:hypothetical protein